MADLRAKLRGTTASTGVLLLLTAASVALTACGGGGSGGGTAGLHAGGHAQAARSIPIAGSVTQSSDHAAGVTANSVNVAIEVSDGELFPNISSRGWGFEDREAVTSLGEDTDLNGNPWTMIYANRSYDDGSARLTTTFTDADPADLNDDYLAMGLWARIPSRYIDADGEIDQNIGPAQWSNEIEYGVYADGGDPFEQNNVEALTGTATYSGDATAVYVDTGSDEAASLMATVSLTADFGTNADLGTIEGTVSRFQRRNDEPPGRYELTDAQVARLGTVTLGSADIGDSDSGFFTGDTSMTAAGDSLTGKWGGQFYGNGQAPQDRPGAVAGTFGATGGQKAIVGTYGARR